MPSRRCTKTRLFACAVRKKKYLLTNFQRTKVTSETVGENDEKSTDYTVTDHEQSSSYVPQISYKNEQLDFNENAIHNTSVTEPSQQDCQSSAGFIGVMSLDEDGSNDSDRLEGIHTSTPYKQSKESSDVAINTNRPIEIEGRRLVDISFFISAIQKTGRHVPFECSFVDMDITNERQIGMISEFTFVCRCGKEDKISTDNYSNVSEKMNLNTAMVTAMTNVGQGYSQLEEICCCIDMPCMSKQTYMKHQNLVDSAIHDCTWESMEAAAREEADLAKAAGCVDSDGVPEITVIVDGAWCKRSYKTNYNALSGVGCIIGLETKKVLYVGVRNAYCCICARFRAKNQPASQHICFKNWSKTSTSMESDIIVEGFKRSKEMYNLKFVNVIGDGDSSVMSKLTEAQPYGPSTTIKKIECTNHLLRNYVRKLREVSEQKRNEIGPVPGELRIRVRSNLLRLRYAVTGAMKHAKNNVDSPVHDRVRDLQEDIRNGPLHVFGDHSKCKEYFCSGQKPGENNVVEDMKAYGVWQHIMSANNYLASFSFSLLHCVTTNLAETYNSIVCKFVAGKRVNWAQRNSYTTRSEISALSMNEKEGAVRQLHKKLTSGVSPGKHANIISLRRQKRRLQRKKVIQGRFQRKRLCLFPDKDYGLAATNIPDVDEDFYRVREAELLKTLSMDDSKRRELEVNSRGQSCCNLWIDERKKRLTASNFGRVCKMRPSTSCQKLVEQLLYKEFSGNSETRYGLESERIAISELENLLGITVDKCGLFVDKKIPYLAASPDGMFEGKGLVEVKCPAKAQTVTPEEGVNQNLITCCELENGDLVLKKTHNYYFQIQGQLHITEKQFCLFVVWTPRGISVQKIEKDDEFWREKMEEKLKSFYLKCLLPELVDPRFPRGLPIRDKVSK